MSYFASNSAADDLEHLIEGWGRIVSRLARARHVLLLTDYDGTLTPIVERPELASLDEETRQLLTGLSQKRRLHVGIISGRSIRDLQSRTAIRGIIYAGNHGLEIEGPGIDLASPLTDEMRTVLAVLHRLLTNALSGIRGVFVENKQLSLSVHYRTVDRAEAGKVTAIFHKVTGTASLLGKIRVTTGKKVYEVRPPIKWDKGTAVRLIWDRHFATMSGDKVIFYLGDDTTDEDAFRVVNALGGFSILVGEAERRSTAQYFLKSTEEVAQFLRLLLEAN